MRQPFFRRVLAIAAAAIACSTVLAQTYPAKPIKFLVPFPAGSATDVVGRQLADAMGKELGQSIIVDNKAGAQGTIGATSTPTIMVSDRVDATQWASSYSVELSSVTSKISGFGQFSILTPFAFRNTPTRSFVVVLARGTTSTLASYTPILIWK